jgi:hypothetical protein
MTEQHAAQAPALHKRIYSPKFDSAELLDPEPFNPGLTTKGLVADCGLVLCGWLVLKSTKRSVINIQRSMLDVRCSTFNLFTIPARRSLIQVEKDK